MKTQSISKKWDKVRLRNLVTQQLSSERRAILNSADDVSFLPMEAIGEKGELDLSHIRKKHDVETGYTLFFDGDVLVAKITPYFENGKGTVVTNLINGIGFGTTELYVLSPKTTVNSRFLYWITVSHAFRKFGEANMSGAAGQKRVPTDYVNNFRVSFPPLLYQQEIANYLDRETARIDALIAAKQRLLELLAEKRRSLIACYITKGVIDSISLKDSGINWFEEIPKNWTIKRVKFLVSEIEGGFSPQCYNVPPTKGEWGVLKSGCVNKGVFDPQESKTLPSEIEPLLELEIRKGDVLMSRASGSLDLIGSVALVEEEPEARLLLSDKTFRLMIDSNTCDVKFFVVTMGSPIVRQQIRQMISGAEGLANNIAQSDIRELMLPVPPLQEQQQIMEILSQKAWGIDRLIKESVRAITLLQERRTSLISHTITGQLHVTE